MQLPQLVGLIFGFIFPAWPILLFLPLIWRRRGGALVQMFSIWMILLIIWFFARNIPARPSYLIAEPASTYLFFLTGALVFILFRLRENR